MLTATPRGHLQEGYYKQKSHTCQQLLCQSEML